jgi:hypothetical protein
MKTFRETRQTLLLVTDQQEDQHTVVRGLISPTEIERRLGSPLAQLCAAQVQQEPSIF